MIKKCTIAGVILGVCILQISPSFADNYRNISAGNLEDVVADCRPGRVASPLVQPVVEGLVSNPNVAEFWNNQHHLASLLGEIEELPFDGLNPQHYDYSAIKMLHNRVKDGAVLSSCDLEALNQSMVSALKDLHYGRVDPGMAELIWYADGARVQPSETILKGLVSLGLEGGIAQAFKAARPELPAYLNLRKFFITAVENYPENWSTVPSGSLLSFGDVDARVPLLKRRLREDGYLASYTPQQMEDKHFSRELSEAVVDFQHRHSLLEDGVVGPYTLAELNIQPSTRLAQIKVNLERFRWVAHDRESTMVVVDIAGTQVIFVDEGQRRMLTRAQAGRPYRRTPTLKSWITHVTLNPTWTVPPTILRRDVLPAIRRDGDYLASHHIRVLDKSGKEIDPKTVNWSNPGSMILRQDAGPGAALGKVAIRFPNPFSVYLHDTPNQKLFETHGRFYSSGCVRVENAMTLVDLLFENGSEDLLSEFNATKASEKTKNVSLPARIPLLMVYWTVTADEEINPRFRPDIYGRDERLLALLNMP